jgi:transglycosylase-like protein with SLT domain
MQRKPLGADPWRLNPWTPGPLGINDAASPFSEIDGPTPGSWGMNDGSPGCILGMTHGLNVTPPKSAQKDDKASSKNDPIRKAFDRCDELGWVPYFRDAAKENDFDPELLMAIGYRETHLDPKYLKVAGDNGHGYGLMQIDNRSYPDWVNSGKWKDAESCINKGAEVLDSKRTEIQNGIGEKLTVKTLAGVSYEFEGKQIVGADLLRVTVAAYNCGLWAYYHFSKGHDVDRGTTGQDYSKDVLAKAARFKPLLVPKVGDFPGKDVPGPSKSSSIA